MSMAISRVLAFVLLHATQLVRRDSYNVSAVAALAHILRLTLCRTSEPYLLLPVVSRSLAALQ